MNICNTIVANINAEEELRDQVHQVEHSCGEFSGYSILPTEDTVTEINIGTNEESRPILVSQNNEELLAYSLFLKEFRDVFAWSYDDVWFRPLCCYTPAEYQTQVEAS